MLLGQLEHPHTKIKVTTDLTQLAQKLTQNWIRDITIKDKTLKLIEDSIDIVTLDMALNFWAMKQIIDKQFHYIKKNLLQKAISRE